jgi:hypothetical protein
MNLAHVGVEKNTRIVMGNDNLLNKLDLIL